MKKLVFCLVFGLCFAVYSTAFAEKIVSDNFDDSSLVFQSFADDKNYYEIYSPNGLETSDGKIGFKKQVLATTPYLKVEPKIVEQGPLNQKWVFSSGSSNMWRDAHWKHLSGIFYDFDQEINNISVSLKYLNTRACGGILRVVFAQVDDDGNVVWAEGKNIYGWNMWPGPYNPKDRNINNRVWQTLYVDPATIEEMTQSRPVNRIYVYEFDITSEQGSGYLDDVEIYAEPVNQECNAYVDTMPPTGSIHAHNNFLWPPNNKEVPVVINGYVVDELSIARDGEGVGITSAYILLNDEKIVLRDEETNLLDESGHFSFEVMLTASKGAKYDISLFADDTNPEEDGGPNFGLVDSTYVEVSNDMSSGNSKK